MVEVDPAVLIIGGSAIIGATVMAVACSGRSTQRPAKTLPAKKKKPTKAANAKVPSKLESEMPAKEELLPFKQTPAVKKEQTQVDVQPKVASVAAAEVSSAPAPVSVPVTEEVAKVAAEAEPKTSKKPKETAEQKAARLERQKLVKANKLAEELARESTPEPAIAAPTTQSPSVAEELESAVEGWEVVGKAKPKKTKAEEPEKKMEKKVQEELPTAADSARESVVVENKKIGAIIGPKGATLHKIQDVTGTELTVPKERDSLVTITVTGSSEGVKKGEVRISLKLE